MFGFKIYITNISRLILMQFEEVYLVTVNDLYFDNLNSTFINHCHYQSFGDS